MRSRTLWIGAGVAAALGLAAAVAHAEPERPRVATLLPSVESALRAVPGDFAVVATVRRSLHTPAPPDLVDLGNPHAPSFERLAQARPTLVVGDASIHAPLADRLGAGGAAVLLLDTQSVDGMLAGLERVAERVGAGEAMRGETARVRERLAALALPRPLPALAIFGAPGSFLVVTERTWLGDLLARLAFANVGSTPGGGERFPGLVALSDERFAALRPEVVLLVAHGDPAAIRAAFEQRTAPGGPWAGIRARASRGVHVLDPALFSANPGLDVVRAAEALIDLGGSADVAGAPPR
jgi:iron complex transport system substrate-binding protein